jgi:hypothetical protein
MTPESRRERLVAQAIADELVIYDERTHQIHRLNRTAARVWQHADGRRTIAELAAGVRECLADLTSASEYVCAEDSEAIVRVALGQLHRAGLLESTVATSDELLVARLAHMPPLFVPVVESVGAAHGTGARVPQN